MRRFAWKLIIASAILLLLASSAMLPTARHRHARGNRSHSHTHQASGSHSHDHHPDVDYHASHTAIVKDSNGQFQDSASMEREARSGKLLQERAPHLHIVLFGFELSVLLPGVQHVELVTDQFSSDRQSLGLDEPSFEDNLILLHQHLASASQGSLSRRGASSRIPFMAFQSQSLPAWVESHRDSPHDLGEWSGFWSARRTRPPTPPPRTA